MKDVLDSFRNGDQVKGLSSVITVQRDQNIGKRIAIHRINASRCGDSL